MCSLGVVVIIGIVDASYRGFNLFGLWSFPQFGAGDAAARHSINEWHEFTANLLILLAFAHAVAAFAHHYVWRDQLYVWRDQLLNRMKP